MLNLDVLLHDIIKIITCCHLRKLFGGWEEGGEVAITSKLTIKASRFTTQIKTDEKMKENKR